MNKLARTYCIPQYSAPRPAGDVGDDGPSSRPAAKVHVDDDGGARRNREVGDPHGVGEA